MTPPSDVKPVEMTVRAADKRFVVNITNGTITVNEDRSIIEGGKK